MGFKATQSKPFCDKHWVNVGCPHRQLLTSCVIPSSVRSPRVSTSSSLWGHRELWGSTAGRGGMGRDPSTYCSSRLSTTRLLVPCPWLCTSRIQATGSRVWTRASRVQPPSPRSTKRPCAPAAARVRDRDSSWATWPHTPPQRPPITPLPGPTPMYWSAHQYERLWVLRAPCGRALG